VTRRLPAPLPWLAGLLAIYLIAPLAAGIHQLGLADWHSIDVAALSRACAISLGSASLATLIIAVLGIPLGYLLARLPGRAMATLGFAVQLPLALPPLTSGILLLFLVGYSAPLGQLTGGMLTDSFAGIVLAEVFVAAPFLIIAARSSFAAIDPVLEGVAATLGRKPLATFFRVSLPIAWPGISSGVLLAWLRAFGEFGATVMVAYHPYSLPVYTYVAFGAEGLPAMMPILLPTLVLALVIMVLNDGFAGQRRNRRAGPPREDALPPVAAGASPLAPRTAAAEPAGLSLRLEKRLGGFRLDLRWSAQARRLAVLGPSGSGKSLTLQLIAGIAPADQAEIAIGGADLARLDPAVRGVAYVPQSYGLFPHLSVAAQLHFPVGADPLLAHEWTKRFGLAGLEERRPSELSLGQQQRVALARALVRPARLLLLDEPFSALDAPLRVRLRDELLALQHELGATTILVTHDPQEAALLADEILVLVDGRSLQSGPTATVFRRPGSETVARLLGAEHPAEGVVVGEDRIAIGNDVMLTVFGPALRPGERVGWSIRPEHVRFDERGAYQGSIDACVPAGIGGQTLVRLGNAHIRLLGMPERRCRGTPCRVSIDPSAIQVWPRD
jgi:ABC-type Fe3+/spermidine/putrescine transport system ATPase subunit/ABC-type sulfate transport system permease component